MDSIGGNLGYFNKNPDRHAEIAAVLSYIRSAQGPKIVTSTLTKVEVSYYRDEEETVRLSPETETEEVLDFFWKDRSIMRFVDLSDRIALHARRLKRLERSLGYTLKTHDAIHLATASFVGVAEMHPYDRTGHLRFDGQMSFRICPPRILPGIQPLML